MRNGRWAYFFEPPTWARAQGCHVKAKALGENYNAAVERAEYVLLPAFDSWRSHGLTEWLQREEHVFGAFEISHYRPKERPNSVKIVHPKNGEEAWWPLFDDRGESLFPELVAELDAIKQVTVSGLVFRRDRAHRKSRTPPPWITERKDLRYLRSVVKDIVAAAGRHRSARQSRIYAKRTRKQLISGTRKRREERTKAAGLSE
ncbi:hypothetical protein ACVIHI_004263 [Bradyrhizobium sp. USDA 4524]|uniref:hypothetical protein n=1 Tax=unclassified Bradyrhizobium TaxID=2631580 RepID=UPI00209C8AD8|nr:MULTISPECIES: hypothetical protein [unclassified Bradyrhizobium]MCP1842817.1 hypothetical protein [Bradyrhizobium sp. USDA 4538]MCP1903382.1 hypothetical protein [Bradyrhizobium sp. USDA 4537]MCP1990961.1 hypothetical protein [Bradyrhizobium sp. USDA 4539]